MLTMATQHQRWLAGSSARVRSTPSPVKLQCVVICQKPVLTRGTATLCITARVPSNSRCFVLHRHQSLLFLLLLLHAVPVRSAAELEGIRAACAAGRRALDAAHSAVRPGVTTDELDRIVHDSLVGDGAYPSPLNYYNFPKSVCTSVNEVRTPACLPARMCCAVLCHVCCSG